MDVKHTFIPATYQYDKKIKFVNSMEYIMHQEQMITCDVHTIYRINL